MITVKNRIICMIIILSISFMFSECTNSRKCTNNNTRNEGTYNMTRASVYINGQITDISAVVNSKEIILPFINAVEFLGMTVEKENDEIVYINHNNDIYILQYCPDVIFTKDGEEENLMVSPPGSSFYYCRYELGDVLLDSETLAGTLSLMGVVVHINMDYDNLIISITSK